MSSEYSSRPSEGSEKAVIKSVDMTEDMQEVVITLALDGFARLSSTPRFFEKDVAAELKKELDRRFGIAWHVIVGKNFGSYVTHESRHFIYFYVGPLAFLVYKTA